MRPNDETEDPKLEWKDHAVGDHHCPRCAEGFPRGCSCGGLVHGDIRRVPDDGFVQLTRCDRCGEPDE